jgi:hypothetical protein
MPHLPERPEFSGALDGAFLGLRPDDDVCNNRFGHISTLRLMVES